MVYTKHCEGPTYNLLKSSNTLKQCLLKKLTNCLSGSKPCGWNEHGVCDTESDNLLSLKRTLTYMFVNKPEVNEKIPPRNGTYWLSPNMDLCKTRINTSWHVLIQLQVGILHLELISRPLFSIKYNNRRLSLDSAASLPQPLLLIQSTQLVHPITPKRRMRVQCTPNHKAHQHNHVPISIPPPPQIPIIEPLCTLNRIISHSLTPV